MLILEVTPEIDSPATSPSAAHIPPAKYGLAVLFPEIIIFPVL